MTDVIFGWGIRKILWNNAKESGSIEKKELRRSALAGRFGV